MIASMMVTFTMVNEVAPVMALIEVAFMVVEERNYSNGSSNGGCIHSDGGTKLHHMVT